MSCWFQGLLVTYVFLFKVENILAKIGNIVAVGSRYSRNSNETTVSKVWPLFTLRLKKKKIKYQRLKSSCVMAASVDEKHSQLLIC